MRDTLIMWRSVPPDVEKGAFGYISEYWGARCICICMGVHANERQICNWDDQSYANVEVHILSQSENPDVLVRSILRQHPSAIHVIDGLRSSTFRYIRKILKTNRVVNLTESPTLHSNFSLHNTCFATLLYGCLSLRYRKYIDIFFTYGDIAIRFYKKVGFRAIYPYMYCPIVTGSLPAVTVEQPICRLLYIGRFDKQDKGIDLLMQAIDNIPLTTTWNLDIVGGYGADRDEFIAWADNHSNVRFAGRWSQTEIIQHMQNYDVCIVPSRYDGWNLTPYYAIHAGIATIISNKAGSDQLIAVSQAGMVYEAESYKKLQACIEQAIYTPEQVEKWKIQACRYRHRISPAIVGQYFIDVLDYEFYHNSNHPACPWL